MKLVNIGLFKVNQLGISATISIDQSVQKGIYNNTKKSQGFGENGSDGSVIEVFDGVYDKDFVDSSQYAWGHPYMKKGT